MHAYSSNLKNNQPRSHEPSLTSIHIANKRTSIAFQGQRVLPFDETTTFDFFFSLTRDCQVLLVRPS